MSLEEKGIALYDALAERTVHLKPKDFTEFSFHFDVEPERLVVITSHGFRILRPEDGSEVFSVHEYGPRPCVAASGARVAARTQGSVWVWDIGSASPLWRTDPSSRSDATALALSQDGSVLALPGDDSVSVVETTTGAIRHRLRRNLQHCDVVLSLGGEYLALGSDEETEIWSCRDGALLKRLGIYESGTSIPMRFGFLPSSRWLITHSPFGTPRIWDILDGSEVVRLEPGSALLDEQYILAVAPSPKGDLLACGVLNGPQTGYMHGGLRFKDLSLILAPREEIVARVQRKTGLVLDGLDARAQHTLHFQRP